MGFFSKFFGKKDKQPNVNPNRPEEEVTTESPVVIAERNANLDRAYERAQESFKYFWRELWWERHRVIPAHGMAAVKVPFSQQFAGEEEPYVEHMWINEIYFDGAWIYGKLLNNPNHLTNVQAGEPVRVRLEEISDWMLSIAGKAYGAFTVQVLRSNMGAAERAQHDAAWGLDFGDPDHIQVVSDQDTKPENLVEHPMCVNTKEKFEEFFKENPEEVTYVDEEGFGPLHRETLAGNRAIVELLLEHGADPNLRTQDGKTALDYALMMDWEHIIPVLEKHTTIN